MPAIKNPVWTKAVKASADPERAGHQLKLLASTPASSALDKAPSEQARILCSVFSGSQALSAWLVTHPEAFATLTPEALGHPRRAQGLKLEAAKLVAPLSETRDFAGALGRLRVFKQREMLRIAVRDLARLADFQAVVRELSDVADVCLDHVFKLCRQQLQDRFGLPYHQDADGHWQATGVCVLGMGKLGGQELNYSSDVDVLFVYADEGQASKQPPAKNASPGNGLSNHQYFNKLAESFIAEVSRMTTEGTLYRIDLRLRPEGDAGPLSRSLAGYENYYSQWGQTWERMMLIKARCVAGDHALAAEFLEMVQPFRYPRSVSSGVLREVAAMKDRIENEVVKAGELERNVKLGRCGIREIEFVAQTLQLLHAGRLPFLQNAQTVPVLEKLVQYNLLPPGEARSLISAYGFLRDVEHRLQMEDNLQTHTIPVSQPARERLAALMGFSTAAEFEKMRAAHAASVRAVYDKLLKTDTVVPRDSLPREFDGNEEEWKRILAAHAFMDVDHSVRILKEFVYGPGYVHVSTRTTELALRLLPRLFATCPQAGRFPQPVLSDPDRVLTRLDSFIDAYGARATLFETFNGNPTLFDLLLLLFDRSEFLAESAIHTPDLVDELVSSGRLRQRKNAGEILEDLRHGRADADQRSWIRKYHQAELMRIGLRDILGVADFEQNLTELSALADACLQYALEVVQRRLKFKSLPVVIIGLGKLGGAEINYGSDLDILFVTDAAPGKLPGLQRVAVEVMELLSSRTELGIAFVTDARLRPDGEKGLLVNTLEAYEDYYRRRAQLWEIQSITRTRPVAGDLKLGARFQELARVLTDFTPANVARDFASRPKSKTGLAAYSPDWLPKINHMRQRIQKERTPGRQAPLAIKTGVGGLMDAEFIAQTLCLGRGWQEANTLRALQRARDAGVLPRKESDELIDSYRKLRRVEGILRRWSFEGETVLPDEEAPFYRVSVRCGFKSSEEFAEAIATYRSKIRNSYKMVLKDR